MAPKTGFPAGVVRLKDVISSLKKSPKLELSGIKALRLSLATARAHVGARRFIEEELPRIRYANPDLEIDVRQAKMSRATKFRPTMELVLQDGKTENYDLQNKWSVTILKELMDAVGGDPWKSYVAARRLAGKPAIPELEVHAKEIEEQIKRGKEPKGRLLPTLQEHLKAYSPTVVEKKAGSNKILKTTRSPPPGDEKQLHS